MINIYSIYIYIYSLDLDVDNNLKYNLQQQWFYLKRFVII